MLGAPPLLRALTPVSAAVFDPYGDGQGENSRLVHLAIDASPATGWHARLIHHRGLRNLKPGTGRLLDMGGAVTLTGARITLGSIRGADIWFNRLPPTRPAPSRPASTTCGWHAPVTALPSGGSPVVVRCIWPGRKG
jgi:hypothetical protein